MANVFVYGTLKSDGPLNQGWLGAGARITSQFAAVRHMALLDIGDRYPAAIAQSSAISNREFRVLGEIWSIPDEVFAPLKAMEERAGYSCGACEIYTYNDENTQLNAPHDPADIVVAQLFYMNASSYADSQVPRISLGEVKPEFLARFGVKPNYQEVVMVSWNNNPRRMGVNQTAIDRFKYHTYNNNRQQHNNDQEF